MPLFYQTSPQAIVARILLDSSPTLVQIFGGLGQKPQIGADAGDDLEKALLSASGLLIAPDQGRLNYAGAKALLDAAERLFPDYRAVAGARHQMKDGQAVWIDRLLTRTAELAEQGRLLSTPRETGIPDVVRGLASLAPGRFPEGLAELAEQYAAAAKRKSYTDPTLAHALLHTGLEMFPGDERLVSELARLTDASAPARELPNPSPANRGETQGL